MRASNWTEECEWKFWGVFVSNSSRLEWNTEEETCSAVQDFVSFVLSLFIGKINKVLLYLYVILHLHLKCIQPCAAVDTTILFLEQAKRLKSWIKHYKKGTFLQSFAVLCLMCFCSSLSSFIFFFYTFYRLFSCFCVSFSSIFIDLPLFSYMYLHSLFPSFSSFLPSRFSPCSQFPESHVFLCFGNRLAPRGPVLPPQRFIGWWQSFLRGYWLREREREGGPLSFTGWEGNT